MTAPTTRETGLTLVELIVGVVIGGLFLGLLTSVFVSGFVTQRDSTFRDKATGWANVVSATLSSSLRNATADVTVIARNQGVVARVVDSDGGWSCRSWLVEEDGTMRYLDNGHGSITLTAAEQGAPLVRGTIDVVSGLGDGARPARARVISPEVSEPIDTDGDGRTDAFGRSGRTVFIGLSLTVGDVILPITDGVTTQGVLQTEGGSCWSEE